MSAKQANLQVDKATIDRVREILEKFEEKLKEKVKEGREYYHEFNENYET